MLSLGDSRSFVLKMSLDKMDPAPIPQEVRKSDSGSGAGRLGWAGDWAVLSIAFATLAMLIGVAVIAVIFGMSERAQLTELTSHTELRLTNIDRELAALAAGLGQMTARSEAARPDFAAHLLDLLHASLNRALQNEDPILGTKTATALTRNARELKIDTNPQEIGRIGIQFLKLVDDESLSLAPPKGESATPRDPRLSIAAIETVAELIGYRSFLLPNPLGERQEGVPAHSAMLQLPRLHAFAPLDSASKVYSSMRALGEESAGTKARIDLLNRSESILTEDYRAVVVDGYDLKIDGMVLTNVVFSHCKIAYSGEPVVMANVYFSNCTFDLSRQAKSFASAALSPSGQVDLNRK
jgi:hypothetical protein